MTQYVWSDCVREGNAGTGHWVVLGTEGSLDLRVARSQGLAVHGQGHGGVCLCMTVGLPCSRRLVVCSLEPPAALSRHAEAR